MPPLLPLEDLDAGGVDSRSNPVNLPRNRALRCFNWVPKQAGFWELRWGYSTVTMGAVTAAPIHSIFPYRTLDGHKFVMYFQGTTLRVLDTANGAVTVPFVRNTAMVSSAKEQGFFANNHFYYGNGTDQKWYDGFQVRDNGLPTLTAAQTQNITITEGVRELTTAQASTITLTAAGGGSFPADTLTGHLIYVAFFDTSVNEIGPATISAGTGRIVLTLNQKITVANMPNLSTVNANWVKLIGGTIDGGNLAYFFTNTSTNIISCSNSAGILTVTATTHGLATGDVVVLEGTTNFDNIYAVTVISADTFKVNLGLAQSFGANTTGGTIKRIVKAANATTTVDVLAPTQSTFYQVNQNIGLPASSVGGPNPGYQFYASINNALGGGHVGNRVPIGGRVLQTAYRSNWRIANIPSNSFPDGQWGILLGRTGDGAQVPYVCTDTAGNFVTTVVGIGGQQSMTITSSSIDGSLELPSRNGIIPPQCNMFCLAGDYAYAADTGSATLRRSGSFLDQRSGIFVGDPAQSWAPNDIDTFPTAEAITGIFEIDQEIFCGTLHDSAISSNLAGIQQWAAGPWNVGIAGKRAGTKCGAHGFFWVTGDKQLSTFVNGTPVNVSEEYEVAELSQIGDAYLSSVECVYYRNGVKGKDELRIEAQKQDGTPYTIIHDFKLMDSSAPGSPYGQGYSSQFQGSLATVFTSAQIRDASGALQIYAGASTGVLYQLYSTADDAGNQYLADLILLVNGGRSRPSVPFIDWYGDANVGVSVGVTLKTSLVPGSQFAMEDLTSPSNTAQIVQGSEDDFLFRAYLTLPEIRHTYIRFQLNSHSADGDLTLNSPPHMPLESYGRIYELIPAVGDTREV